MKTLKNVKKYAIKFDRKCKNAKHRCHQQIYYKLRHGGGGGYSVLVKYQFLSNFFSLATPPIIFLKEWGGGAIQYLLITNFSQIASLSPPPITFLKE